jgi:pimeloyl-ACP methyl ester carboxylesterase
MDFMYIENTENTAKPAKTALVLQGWGTDRNVYINLINHLSKSYNVILPELPGFGATPEPSEPWGVSDYADYVAQFCESENIHPDILLCHSLGCRIATKLLSGGTMWMPSPAHIIYTGAAGIKPKRTTAQKLRTRVFKLKKLFAKPFPKLTEKLRNRYGSADYKAASPIMRQCLVKIVNEDLTPLLPLIKQEVLLIWGENDDSTPLSDGRLMEQLIPNAGLAVIRNAGHYAFLEQPALFYKILDTYLGSSV